ncbi:MAG: acetoacetate decarboxylase family protein [Planctomycetota bacterium]|jgi:acetoacetate decarboxylase|nr:acetoacetate decarboxylase family protein [Planctomycetota bacterium]MDP7249668.1 acetoacetate decarboxylase family protein [Planctomycetota bacterium]
MSFTFQPGMMYRMPVVFGPAMGPRQGPDGRKFDCIDNPKTTTVAVSFRSNLEQLAELLPECFELDGEPIVTVAASYMTEIEWLAGRDYNILGVTIPAVFRGDRDTARGPFLTVLWENLADPIITGREELGFAKIYCELPDAEISSDRVRCTAGWLGFEFMEMKLTNLTEKSDSTENAASPVDGKLHYKYFPRTGEWGTSDVCHAVMTPAETPNRKVVEQFSAEGAIKWNRATWEDLPTLCPIVNGLAELEVIEFTSASLVRTIGGKDLSDQRILR